MQNGIYFYYGYWNWRTSVGDEVIITRNLSELIFPFSDNPNTPINFYSKAA